MRSASRAPSLTGLAVCCRMLITLIKYQPRITVEQLSSISAAFTTMRERCCGEGNPQACFEREVPSLSPARSEPDGNAERPQGRLSLALLSPLPDSIAHRYFTFFQGPELIKRSEKLLSA